MELLNLEKIKFTMQWSVDNFFPVCGPFISDVKGLTTSHLLFEGGGFF